MVEFGLVAQHESPSSSIVGGLADRSSGEFRLEVGIQRVRSLLRWTVLACRLAYPVGPEECKCLGGEAADTKTSDTMTAPAVTSVASTLRLVAVPRSSSPLAAGVGTTTGMSVVAEFASTAGAATATFGAGIFASASNAAARTKS